MSFTGLNIFRQIVHQNKKLTQCQLIRWKGHSKWANIKHTKAAKDQAFSRLSSRYATLISMAVKDNSNETDPNRNKALSR